MPNSGLRCAVAKGVMRTNMLRARTTFVQLPALPQVHLA